VAAVAAEQTKTRPAVAAEQATTRLCLSCCTQNDPDARFCKGCGYQLGDW
jgi:ribosomal protein L40E